jgi:hypothetical protein
MEVRPGALVVINNGRKAQSDNRLGYVLVDSERRVMGPPDTELDPVFHSKDRAVAAADSYGRREDVFDIVEEHLEGIFNVVVWDEGDIMLDGQCGKRFIKACRRRGLKPDKRSSKTINRFDKDNKYSARSLFAISI